MQEETESDWLLHHLIAPYLVVVMVTAIHHVRCNASTKCSSVKKFSFRTFSVAAKPTTLVEADVLSSFVLRFMEVL